MLQNTFTIHHILNFIAQGNFCAAKNGIKSLLAINPNEDKLYELYYYCLQKLQEAEKMCVVPPTKTSVFCPWKEIMFQGRQQANKQNYNQAIALFAQSAQLMKESRSHSVFASQHLSQEEKELLLGQERLLYYQAVCFYLKKDTSQARAYFNASLQARLQAVYQNVAECVEVFLRLKQPLRALTYINELLANKTEATRFSLYRIRAKIYRNLGLAENQKRDEAQALVYYQRRIKRFALEASSYEELSSFLIEIGKYEEALQINAKAIALEPNFYIYYLTRAKIYALLKNKDAAFKTLALLAKESFSMENQFFALERGEVYEILKDYDAAEACYLQETERPGNRRDYLVSLYVQTGRTDKIHGVNQQLAQEKEFDDRVSEQMWRSLLN